MTSNPTPHVWISNVAFARMTGIRQICMHCRLGVETLRDPRAKATCPGKPEAER